jgi:hypothetical protein
MVLPVPAPSTHSAGQSGGQEVTSPARTSSTVSTAAAGAAALVDGAKQDLLGDDGGSQPASATAAAAQKPAPSPLDLLSGLDFSFEAPAAPLPRATSAGPAPAATTNPFADLHPAPAPAPQPNRSANPFGDPLPSPAPAGPPAGSWKPQQAAVQQPAWGMPSPQQAPVHSQQSFGPSLASPAAAAPAVVSDDPFAGFGVPSPAAPSSGGYWAPAPAPAPAQYGAGGPEPPSWQLTCCTRRFALPGIDPPTPRCECSAAFWWGWRRAVQGGAERPIRCADGPAEQGQPGCCRCALLPLSQACLCASGQLTVLVRACTVQAASRLRRGWVCTDGAPGLGHFAIQLIVYLLFVCPVSSRVSHTLQT